MPLTIDTRPQKEFNGNSSLLSTYNCSYLPVNYTLIRMDMTIIIIQNNGGNAQVLVPDDAVSAAVNPGDVIYINSRFYDTSAEVLSIAGGFGSAYEFTLDLPFTLASLGGYANNLARENYHAEVTIKGWNRTSAAYESFGILKVAPDGKGIINLNIGSYLNKNITHYNDSLAVRNERNDSQGSWYYLETLERWVGSSESVVIDGLSLPNLAYFIAATKQNGSEYGNNLADYTPFAVDTAGNPKAKWLTDFDSPTLFVGYPFDISVLLPLELQGFTMTLEQEYLNASGTVINTDDSDIDVSQINGVNRMLPIGAMVGDPAFSSVAGTDAVNVWIEIGGIAQIGYVAEDYRAPGYDELVPPTAPGAITAFRITQKQKIRIVTDCLGPYIRWKGSKANWNYWMFSFRYEISSKPTIQGTREVYNSDVRLAYTDTDIIKMNTADTIKLFARVRIEDIAGFKSIEQSPVIQLYTPDLETEWQTLNIIPGSIKYNNDQSYVNVEISFKKHDFNVISL